VIAENSRWGQALAQSAITLAGAPPLTREAIAKADAVIFAADVEVRDRARFAGKPLVSGGVKRAINSASALIEEAKAAAAAGLPVGGVPTGRPAAGPTGPATKVDREAHFGIRLRQWLMAGVSYMIPFVAGDLIESGKLTPVIDRTYPLSATPAAIQHMAEGRARGRSSST